MVWAVAPWVPAPRMACPVAPGFQRSPVLGLRVVGAAAAVDELESFWLSTLVVRALATIVFDAGAASQGLG